MTEAWSVAIASVTDLHILLQSPWPNKSSKREKNEKWSLDFKYIAAIRFISVEITQFLTREITILTIHNSIQIRGNNQHHTIHIGGNNWFRPREITWFTSGEITFDCLLKLLLIIQGLAFYQVPTMVIIENTMIV